MSVKKTTKPTRSVRYLLSGDSKLQRLSLRKISAHGKDAKTAARAKEATLRAKHGAGDDGVAGAASGVVGRVIVVGVACLLAAAALLTARQPAAPLDRESIGVPADSAPSEQVRLTAAPEASTPAVPKPSTTPAVTASVRPAVEKTSTAAPVKPAARPADPDVNAAAPRTPAAAASTSTVTVEGCLAINDRAYYLKDASGLKAPKARSWRSGFLVKRSPSIELVDAGGGLSLHAYVGQRIAATGALTNREMQVRTLRRVSDSCR